MALTLSLPTIDTHPANRPETHPGRVAEWLQSLARYDPAEAARTAGDALAATNRVPMSDSRRLELAESYWRMADSVWLQLERRFSHVPHPLSGAALESAKAALSLSHELSVAYKHLLAREADRRMLLTGTRQLRVLIHRCLDSMVRTITTCYVAYSPVPPKTWLDAHRVYAFARDRGLHLQAARGDEKTTPERTYVQVLLLALANPYGLRPGQLGTVLRFLQAYGPCAKLTDVEPVHRNAKAVAIIPVGHDFPPFSASKGGSIEGRKLYLLTFDLAFEIQEQLRALAAGAHAPADAGRDSESRGAYVNLLNRLLRQWAMPPTRQFARVPSRARLTTFAGLPDVWQAIQAAHPRRETGVLLATLTRCEVINHTPGGYALRQIDAKSTALRIGELIAVSMAAGGTPQIALVRWFRNTLRGSSLEFGCELLSDNAEAALAAPEGAGDDDGVRILVLPPEGAPDDADAPLPQLLVPADVFRVEQALTLTRARTRSFAVLTKLIEQGPGIELYEYMAVG